jgi:ABC-type nitrate/sulfonate/bicarbonate transport system substrate-binding protein
MSALADDSRSDVLESQSPPAVRAIKTGQVSELWYTRCPLPAASGIAQRKGWLRQEFLADGIAVDTIRTSKDRAVRDSHFTHAQPNLFREGGPVPPIWAKARGQDTALIGITRTDEASAVLVKADSPVRLLSDLRGRRMAVPRHATQYADHARAHTLRGFLAALELGGLSEADVAFSDVAEDEYEIREPPVAVGQTEFPILDALVADRVDAVFVRGGRIREFIARYNLRPLPISADDADGGIRIGPGTPRAVTVNRELAVRHPEIVARYLAVLQRAAAWARANPKQAVTVAAAETGATEEGIASGFGPRLTEQLSVSLAADHVAALEAEKNFLLARGFLAGDFDFQAWIVSEPLRLAALIP